ncbi:MAG: serine/threonine protein kinase [Bdellovibrionales bacterium]
MNQAGVHFHQLTPDFVLNAVESAGWPLTGEFFQLNSYENRVFSLRVEGADKTQVIAKFYRPERWSDAAIREEHEFLAELTAAGVSVVAPLKQKNGDTLSLHDGLWCAVFPKARGRMPQEFQTEDLTQLGRVIARLHNVGAQKASRHRPIIDGEHMGLAALDVIEPLVPHSIASRYFAAADEILSYLSEHLRPESYIRIHGDCHRGNVLQTDEAGAKREYLLIDFDDFGMGHVAQDLWMLFRQDEDVDDEIDAFLQGYIELRDFQESDLELMAPLRGLRILHYAAWIARRWADPSFPQLFPQFGSESYWFEEMQALERIAHGINLP